MAVTTTHVAQVTGTPPFVNARVPGVDLGASTMHNGRCYIFFGDVAPLEGGDWGEPWRLAAQGSAAPGGLATSSRHQSNVDVFWIGPDGGIAVKSWNGPWSDAWRLAPAGWGAPGRIAAGSRHQDNLDVFWVGSAGGVGVRSWNGDWENPWELAPQGSAVPNSVVTTSRHEGNRDVFWIAVDGSVVARSWNGAWGNAWQMAPPGSAIPGSLAANARHQGNVDVCWISPVGSVVMRSWNGDWANAWHVAPQGSAAPGCVAVSSRHENNLDVYWIGLGGGIGTRSWNGSWGEPWRLAPENSALPGSVVANSRHQDNVDVFWIGPDGGVGVKSWNGSWGEPWRLAPQGSAVPGSLAASSRHRDNIDVFWVEPDGGVGARSWSGGGPVHDADAVAWIRELSPNGVSLELILDGEVFAPIKVRKPNEFLLMPQSGQTPTGAFSHQNFAYVFYLIHDKPRDPQWSAPATYLVRTSDPASSAPYDEVFRLSQAKFWQVAPWVVNNATVAGLPDRTSVGVVMLGGGAADGGGDAVHLAWMPLRMDGPPRLDEIRYYGGPDVRWSSVADETLAKPLWKLPGGYTSISLAFVEARRRWIAVYSRAITERPHESIVARWADLPTGPWSDEIVLFTPGPDSYGHFMLFPNSTYPDVPDPSGLGPERGLPYGPFIIAPLTAWHPEDQTVELHYLMSTWRPYQVHHMCSRFRLD